MLNGTTTLESSAEFHLRLADAAHNEAMADFVRSCTRVLVERTPMLEAIDGFIEWELDQHRGIYRAVHDARPKLAARRMTEHLDGVAGYQVRLGMPEL